MCKFQQEETSSSSSLRCLSLRKTDWPYDECNPRPTINAVNEQYNRPTVHLFHGGENNCEVVTVVHSTLGGMIMHDDLWLVHFSCNTCIMMHSGHSQSRLILLWNRRQQCQLVLEFKQ